MHCFFCPSVAHEATGCVYAPNVLACRECTVEFWRWFRHNQNTRIRRVEGKLLFFYDSEGRWIFTPADS